MSIRGSKRDINQLTTTELKVLNSTRGYDFKVERNHKSGQPLIHMENKAGQEVALIEPGFSEVKVHNKSTGDEDTKKDLEAAVHHVVEQDRERKAKTEAVVIIGNEKYFSRAGRYYHYDAAGKRTEITGEAYHQAINGDRKALASQQKPPQPVSEEPRPKKARQAVKRELDPDMLQDIPGYFAMTEDEFKALEPGAQVAKINKAIGYTKPTLSQAQEVLGKHGTSIVLTGRGKYSVKDKEGNVTSMSGKDVAELAKKTVADAAIRKLGIEGVEADVTQSAIRDTKRTRTQQTQKQTTQKGAVKNYNHGLDINLEDSRQSDKTKKAVRSHFENEILPTLPDDTKVDYRGAGAGFVSLTTPRGTTKNPVTVYSNVIYNDDGTMSYEAMVEDDKTGDYVEVEDIPIRDIKDIDDIVDRCARGLHDTFKGKKTISLKELSKQERSLRETLIDRSRRNQRFEHLKRLARAREGKNELRKTLK